MSPISCITTLENGKIFCALFNIGLDIIEKAELIFDRKISEIKKLTENGDLEDLQFIKIGENYIIDTCCNILEPVVLIASEQ